MISDSSQNLLYQIFLFKIKKKIHRISSPKTYDKVDLQKKKGRIVPHVCLYIIHCHTRILIYISGLMFDDKKRGKLLRKSLNENINLYYRRERIYIRKGGIDYRFFFVFNTFSYWHPQFNRIEITLLFQFFCIQKFYLKISGCFYKIFLKKINLNFEPSSTLIRFSKTRMYQLL